MIRPATFSDVPRLAEIMEALFQRSIYRDRTTIDVKATKALFLNAIRRHGQTTEGGSCVFVGERDGTVEGFIIGLMARVYHVCDALVAQDLYFVVTDKGRGFASGLVEQYLAWARSGDRVIEINLSATDVVGDFARTEKLFRRKGFVQSGIIYRKELP